MRAGNSRLSPKGTILMLKKNRKKRTAALPKQKGEAVELLMQRANVPRSRKRLKEAKLLAVANRRALLFLVIGAAVAAVCLAVLFLRLQSAH